MSYKLAYQKFNKALPNWTVYLYFCTSYVILEAIRRLMTTTFRKHTPLKIKSKL
jgi:hypothetical protein